MADVNKGTEIKGGLQKLEVFSLILQISIEGKETV
jgi:hypothetical protein